MQSTKRARVIIFETIGVSLGLGILFLWMLALPEIDTYLYKPAYAVHELSTLQQGARDFHAADIEAIAPLVIAEGK